MKKTFSAALAGAVILTGCASTEGRENTVRGALAGAVIGAGLGTLAGGDDGRNAAIGAVVGAIAGGSVGAYMDRQEAELRQKTAGTGIGVVRNGDQIELLLPSDLTFDSNESAVEPSFYQPLNEVATTLNEYPSTAIDVVGHADSSGDAGYNQTLSEARATSVSGYLASQGVESVRLYTAGKGEMDPIADNATPEGRAQNRRVQILLTPITEG